MDYLLTASQMQRFDQNTIVNIGIPSAVLMERAALAVVEEIKLRFSTEKRILVVAGKGNNGGDGLAIARLLLLLGYHVDTYLAGDLGKEGTAENTRQKSILLKYSGVLVREPEYHAYDVIIDALFGIGLSREVSAPYDDIVTKMNESGAYIVAVDLPSGIHTDSGAVMGCAVKANLTVTFGYYKKGHFLFPGSLYCGELVKKDVGIYHDTSLLEENYCFTISDSSSKLLPNRVPDGNKGTFGKLLIVAGSKETAGAAVLAAKAAFAMGVGMVKLFIHKEQKDVILYHLPECMVETYTEETELDELKERLNQAIAWSNGILVGPGIGLSPLSKTMVKTCLGQKDKTIVLDADALNILSQNREELYPVVQSHNGKLIMTPHLGEFARLVNQPMSQVKMQKEGLCRSFAKEMSCTLVCKDARTYVVDRNQKALYINTSGNDGMATAGSGDVLSGVIAVLMLQEASAFDAAVHAVCLHGFAGDVCANEIGKRSTKASDLVEVLTKIINKIEVE